MLDLKLTVVDQAPISAGDQRTNANKALQESVTLGQKCDEWGYKRHWIAEHHSNPNFASSAPEMLVAAIAATTKNIHVGTGGIMLPHYSPFKVAEQFQTLERLFPGRIDLGIGRAPGGDGLASHALALPHNPTNEDTYAEQAQLLTAFLRDEFPNDHPYHELQPIPGDRCSPELWMLGSSGGSAALAGQLGYKMALSLFIGPEERPLAIFEQYKQAWKNAKHQGQPEAIVATSAVCADTDEEALALAGPQSYWKTQVFRHGIREPLNTPDKIPDLVRKLSQSDQAFFQANVDTTIIGSPTTCREKLMRLSEHWGCNEIALVTVTHSSAARLRSYELLAKD